MRFKYKSWTALTFTCLYCCYIVAQEPEKNIASLRESVLKSDDGHQKADAYRSLFLKVGRAGLAELTKDADIGIALQSAWEVNTKGLKRSPSVRGQSEFYYDPAGLKTFLSFMNTRTKVSIPDWWSKSIQEVDLSPGRHHAFGYLQAPNRLKLHQSKYGPLVPNDVELEEINGEIIYRTGMQFIKFPNDIFGDRSDCYAGAIGMKRSSIAGYSAISGFEYQIAGFSGEGGKPEWKTNVWSAGRESLGGRGYHYVEIVAHDGKVYVFGAETHGMYLECFDLVTGKCQFRFCTCYWFHPSERWDLK